MSQPDYKIRDDQVQLNCLHFSPKQLYLQWYSFSRCFGKKPLAILRQIDASHAIGILLFDAH